MADVSTADKVAFLSTPAAYAERPASVERKETHMSWIFLADRFVWKLKKPVRYGYLDFSTLESRRRHCELEVELNRRLAADVYLGIAPLVRNSHGTLQLGGDGEIVDWLVRMRRLPSNRMLDFAIAASTATLDDARRVGALLYDFYRQARRIDLAPAAYAARLNAETDECEIELSRPAYRLPASRVASLCAAQRDFVARESRLLNERLRSGRIVDAHGDLRPEHICLCPNMPAIIDCLEFNADFRILDPASELAYLTLECRRLGAAWFGDEVLRTCLAFAVDDVPACLIDYYRQHHALIRAKIAAWHLKDPDVCDPENWIARAQEYLRFAELFH